MHVVCTPTKKVVIQLSISCGMKTAITKRRQKGRRRQRRRRRRPTGPADRSGTGGGDSTSPVLPPDPPIDPPPPHFLTLSSTVAPTHWRFRRLQATSLSASRRGPTHQIHHLSHCRSDEPCFFVSTDHMVGARTTSPAATPASGELGQYQRGQRIVWAQRTRILRLAGHRVIRHRSS